MPPRRRVGVRNEEAEGNPPLTAEAIAEIITQRLNEMMPNIITQVAQVLNIEHSAGDEGSTEGGAGGAEGGAGGAEGGTGGDGAGNGGGEGAARRNDNRRNDAGDNMQAARVRPCTFEVFSKCNPPKFSGEDGAVSLLTWFENMEAMLYHSQCEERRQVEFASSQFTSLARTWWAGVVQEIGRPAAYAWTWAQLMERMREQFCPREAVMELEQELWSLEMKGHDIEKYIVRFNELARLVPYMVNTEEIKIERFTRGLIDEVRRGVWLTPPKCGIKGANNLELS